MKAGSDPEDVTVAQQGGSRRDEETWTGADATVLESCKYSPRLQVLNIILGINLPADTDEAGP